MKIDLEQLQELLRLARMGHHAERLAEALAELAERCEDEALYCSPLDHARTALTAFWQEQEK